MKTETKSTSVPEDIMADAKIVAECVATGRPIPPDVARRVHEEARKITERVYREHGLLNIGVPAIRELRGELPRP
jgi:hypothetical protein